MKPLPSDFYSRRLKSPPRDYSAFAQFVYRFASTVRAPLIVDLGVGNGDVIQTVRAVIPNAATIVIDHDVALACAAMQHSRAVLADFDASLPFQDGCTDAAILSFVLHLAADRGQLLKECRRILRKDGYAFILTASESQLAARVLNRFFPSLEELDRRRYAPLATLQEELQQSGFHLSAVETLHLGDIMLDHAFVDRMERASWSSFALLDANERRDGVRRLRAYLDEQQAGTLPFRSAWRRSAIAACAI